MNLNDCSRLAAYTSTRATPFHLKEAGSATWNRVDNSQSASRPARILSLQFVFSFVVLLAIGEPSALAAPSGNNAPAQLTCGAMREPLGIDIAKPRLSWQLQDKRRGAKQTAYEVRVASSADSLTREQVDVWDSGRVESDQSVGVVYAGPELESRRRYYWQVRVWDQQEQPTSYSETSWWEMGLLSPQDWNAKWITRDMLVERGDYEREPKWIWAANEIGLTNATAGEHAFRFHFTLAEKPKDAVLFITAKDNSRAWMNGEKILEASLPRGYGDVFLREPWGTFRVITVTRILNQGSNTIAAEVVVQKGNPGGPNRAGLIALLRVRMPNGKLERFISGPEWKTGGEQTGEWFKSAFNDTSWPNAAVIERGAELLGTPWPAQPASLLRRAFTVARAVRSARIYSTALGSYQLYLNGQRIGKDVLAPGWTDYRKRIVYQVYDVTSQLVKGGNAIGAILGGGWYADALTWWQPRYNFGPPPVRILVQLEIEYTDGTRASIVTDESWRAAQSPVLRSEIYDGEYYDARLEQKGWDQPLFSDTHWHPAILAPTPGAPVVAQDFEPIRVEQAVMPKAVTNPAPGVYVFDLGQNIAGTERLSLSGHAGTKVRLRFGEVLKPDGNLYTDNLRTAEATDTYVLRGKGPEVFEPHFTYHGFRYIEVTGYPGKPPQDAVEGLVSHTDAPFISQFRTANEMVNQLWSNILWSQRGNLQSVPTDCPQRDERLGWMGDAELFWRTATFNQNLDAFSHKFTTDIRDAQSTSGAFTDVSPAFGPISNSVAGWADAGVIIPWTTYLQYRDNSILQENWAAMEKWMEHLERANPDHLWLKERGYDYGDWLSIGSKTPKELIATAFWANDASLMMRMAQVLNRPLDMEKYAKLFDQIRMAFDREFVRPDGTIGNGTQTGDVLALHMNLLSESLRARVVEELVQDIEAHDGHLTTGLLGTAYLLPELSNNAHTETAYTLLLTKTYPSWGYAIEHGATTIWERWNGDQMMGDPSMNSFNQYVFGAVGEWLYRYAAGIDEDPEDPGFHRIILHPEFDARIGAVNARYDSPYGPITSAWKVAQDTVTWTVVVPANSTALIYFPAETSARIFDDGKEIRQSPGLSFVLRDSAKVVYEAAAGSYNFTIKR